MFAADEGQKAKAQVLLSGDGDFLSAHCSEVGVQSITNADG